VAENNCFIISSRFIGQELGQGLITQFFSWRHRRRCVCGIQLVDGGSGSFAYISRIQADWQVRLI
jgi:hypothetical protein